MRTDNLQRPPAAGSSRRKTQHVSRACNTCRRRKSKCDGVQPICAGCRTSGHECTWSAEEDSRRPATRQYVESLKNVNASLEARVQMLTAKLAALGASADDKELLSPSLTLTPLMTTGLTAGQLSPLRSESPSPGGFGPPSPIENLGLEIPLPEGDQESETDRLTSAAGRLVLEDNELHHYGPTSPMTKLPSQSLNHPPVSPNLRATDLGGDEKYELQLPSPSSSAPFLHAGATGPEPAACDWSRHLPQTIPLTRSEHDFILDLFFKFFSSWCYRIVPDLFLRDMFAALKTPATPRSPSAGATPPDPSHPMFISPKLSHYSPMLHNAILAVAAAFSDDLQINNRETKYTFAKLAKDYIEDECQRPTLSTVQALALLSSFHSGQSEQSLGYLYFGMSVRMSQALGLGVDCSSWVRSGHIAPADMTDRIWTFWTTFTLDKCWALFVGRDFSLPLPYPSLPLPITDSEVDKKIWFWRRPSSQSPTGGSGPSSPVDGPTPSRREPLLLNISRAFIETCKLMTLGTTIMTVVYGMNRQMTNEAHKVLINDIHLKLDTWLEELPDELRVNRPKSTTSALPHILMLQLAYNWLTILLHRPFYRSGSGSGGSPTTATATSPQIAIPPPSFADLSIKRCDSAADKIVHLLGAYRRLYTLRYTPITAIQIAYTAGMTYILCAVHFAGRPAKRRSALEGVKACIEFLNEMGGTWESSKRSASMLKDLLKEQVAEVELSPLPSRRPTVEVQPPTATPSRQQSMDFPMDFDAAFPSSLHSFSGNLSEEPETNAFITNLFSSLQGTPSPDEGFEAQQFSPLSQPGMYYPSPQQGQHQQQGPPQLANLQQLSQMAQHHLGGLGPRTQYSFPQFDAVYNANPDSAGMGMRVGETFPPQPFGFGASQTVIGSDEILRQAAFNNQQQNNAHYGYGSQAGHGGGQPMF